MSWIVQHLLKNKDIIKETCDLESDEYNNLLVVESKIAELSKGGFLSDVDLWIIDLVSDGRPIRHLETDIGKNRITLSRTFVQICERISYFLGGYFTDDGFLENMKDEYKINDEDISKLREYMTGKFKHKLMKKNQKMEII